MRDFDLLEVYKWSAIVLIAITGLIHLVTADGHFKDATWVGIILLTNMGAALVAAFGIIQEKLWGWLLGFAVAGGAFVAYIISRAVGLPRFFERVGEWAHPFGILSLIVEAAFVALFLWVVAARRHELEGI